MSHLSDCEMKRRDRQREREKERERERERERVRDREGLIIIRFVSTGRFETKRNKPGIYPTLFKFARSNLLQL